METGWVDIRNLKITLIMLCPGQCSILNIDPGSQRYRIVSVYDAATEELTELSPTIWPGDCSNQVYSNMRVKLDGGCSLNSTSYPPPEFPICGALGDICESEGPNIPLIVSVLLGVLLILISVAGYLVYRHYKEEADIASMHWKICLDDILASKDVRGRYETRRYSC